MKRGCVKKRQSGSLALALVNIAMIVFTGNDGNTMGQTYSSNEQSQFQRTVNPGASSWQRGSYQSDWNGGGLSTSVVGKSATADDDDSWRMPSPEREVEDDTPMSFGTYEPQGSSRYGMINEFGDDQSSNIQSGLGSGDAPSVHSETTEQGNVPKSHDASRSNSPTRSKYDKPRGRSRSPDRSHRKGRSRSRSRDRHRDEPRSRRSRSRSRGRGKDRRDRRSRSGSRSRKRPHSRSRSRSPSSKKKRHEHSGSPDEKTRDTAPPGDPYYRNVTDEMIEVRNIDLVKSVEK